MAARFALCGHFLGLISFMKSVDAFLLLFLLNHGKRCGAFQVRATRAGAMVDARQRAAFVILFNFSTPEDIARAADDLGFPLLAEYPSSAKLKRLMRLAWNEADASTIQKVSRANLQCGMQPDSEHTAILRSLGVELA